MSASQTLSRALLLHSHPKWHVSETRTLKIHAIVDALGNPLYFQLSAGNVNDSTMAVEVLSHVNIADSTILADKAYGTNEILDFIQLHDADYAIPPKSNTRVSSSLSILEM